MKKALVIGLVTIFLIAIGVGVFLYFQLFAPREQRTIGIAESSNSNHVIKVVYTDYGGSFAEKGGIHIDVFLMEGGMFAPKENITKLVSDVLPCASAMGACTKRVSDGQSFDCEGNVWKLDDGGQGCVTKRLESFEIKNDKLTWYGEQFEL
jgi:hypothetical protein